MLDTATPTAPAPETTATPTTPPAPISAARDAANRGDFGAFDDAHLAAKRGAPLPKVSAPADAAKVPETAEPTAADNTPQAVSRRQQQINDKIRDAVDRATAALREENARLKSSGAPAPPTEPPPAASAKTWQDAITAPDPTRPLLSEDQFFDQFPDAPYSAYARYAVRHDAASQQHAAHQRAEAEGRTKAVAERIGGWVQKIEEAKQADPDLLSKLPPAVLQAAPASALPPGAPVTFANVVAEAALDADDPAALLAYLHAHPDETSRIASLPGPQWLTHLYKLDGRLSAAKSAPAVSSAVPSSITAAPPPAPILTKPGSTSDPMAAALKSGDFATFDQLERARKLSTRQRSA